MWNGRTPDSKGRRTRYPKVIRTPDPCIIRTPCSNIIRTGYPKVIRTPDPKDIRTGYPKVIRTPDCNVALPGLPHMRVLGLTKSKDPTLCNLIVSHMTYDSYTLYKIIYIYK